MKLNDVTFGMPVRNLAAAIDWYRSALELDAPGLEPLDGLVEFDMGSFWLQLALDPRRAGVEGASINISVEDAAAEQQRMAAMGLEVTDLQRFDGVVDFFELTDPDGNKIGFVTELR